MTAGPAPTAGSDAALVAALFAVDPVGLGGVVLRGRPGPERDGWLATLRALLPPATPVGRVPLGIADDRLLGGLDLSLSLSAGRPVIERGVLAANDGGVVVAPMAERLDDATAGKLSAVLDTGEVAVERDGLTARLPARVGMVLLDEGIEPEERPPTALLERMAFCLNLENLSFPPLTPAEAGAQKRDPERGSSAARNDRDRESFWTPASAGASEGESSARSIQEARLHLKTLPATPDPIVEALCASASAFGLDSIRPSLFAVRAARAHAALRRSPIVTEEDAAVAARLVLAPRALTFPAQAPDEDAPTPEAEPPPSPDDAMPAEERDLEGLDAEMVLAAVQAALPDRLLEQIVADNRRSARTPRRTGSGDTVKSAKRGRPVGSRAGALRPGDRLNLVDTLRAAAPWQRLRAAGDGAARVRVRPDDFRIRRFVQKRESTTIFLVDASGSAAAQRLAEAKGAVELLLAKAYVSRARVALIAFRGAQAETLLAPTRSLTRARRSLADLPGGGGTPLALGLDAALDLAQAEKARERTPLLVVLTDGRANIGRDGSPGRAGAEADALAAAARIGEASIGAAFLDTSPRPAPGGDRFAKAANAVYAPLPYADGARVSAVVDDLRGGRRG